MKTSMYLIWYEIRSNSIRLMNEFFFSKVPGFKSISFVCLSIDTTKLNNWELEKKVLLVVGLCNNIAGLSKTKWSPFVITYLMRIRAIYSRATFMEFTSEINVTSMLCKHEYIIEVCRVLLKAWKFLFSWVVGELELLHLLFSCNWRFRIYYENCPKLTTNF